MNVVITGVSRGIGRALVEAYLKDGHHVYAITRSQKPVLGAIDAESYKDTYRQLVFDWDDIDAFVGSQLLHVVNGKAVDILINNAGTLHTGRLLDVTAEDFRHHYEINALYPLMLSRSLIRHGLLRGGAHIINIGSMSGYQGASKYPGLGAYAMSKGALSILTEVMAVEWAGLGISVNCLCLGAVETEMLKRAFPGLEGAIKVSDMAGFIKAFGGTAGGIINGKLIPVSSTDPEA